MSGSRDAGLFLDRDGTIIEDSGYLADPTAIRLLPGAKDAIARAARKFALYLVTNQSGIGRGYYSMEDAVECNNAMERMLGLEEGFAGVCIAPERPDQPSDYRKPSPKYVLEMIARDRLDPAKCYMAGDRLSDIQCGVNAGITPILIWNQRYCTEETAQFCERHGIKKYASLAEFINDALKPAL